MSKDKVQRLEIEHALKTFHFLFLCKAKCQFLVFYISLAMFTLSKVVIKRKYFFFKDLILI